MSTPQIRQTDGRGVESLTANAATMPLLSRFRVCVRRVAGLTRLPCLASEDHNVCEIHSANGATARRHISAVSESRTANEPIKRQFPSRCSKNQSRCNGPRRNQSSKNASTWGRIGSIKSHARLSRVRVSLWRNPIPGSSPNAASASLASDSSTA